MAMLPFIGYHAGDYLNHWLTIGQHADPNKLPKIFQVNWFRRGHDDHFLWPGYGDNCRVLKWIAERIDDTAQAIDTPIGLVPPPAAIDSAGLSLRPGDLTHALSVDVDEWVAEIPQITEWFATFGDKLPTQLWNELKSVRDRLQ
jgi:phosphoenolpyruvate carboxykinase (GTP)